MKKENQLKIFAVDPEQKESISLSLSSVKAGFPSPADNFIEDKISLDKELIRNKEATFYARVEGDSMKDAHIEDGDLLVIDRSIEVHNNKIAVCFVDGEFTVKRLRIEKDVIWLDAENPNFASIKVTSDNEFMVWGIITYIIKKV